MTSSDLRLLSIGALGGLGLGAALGAARLQPEPVAAAPNADMRLTWSADGRTVYLWRIVGTTVEYQSTWRAPGGPRAAADDAGAGDKPEKDQSKPDQPVRGHRPDRQ
jgi:hypothetical protein